MATALVVVVAAFAALALGARYLWGRASGPPTPVGCTFGSYTVNTGQASVAATMVGVTLLRGLPERAAVLVLMAGWQESKLRNIPAGQGDRDSVGVLQQRPSQGWGTAAELADVATATGKFLDQLVTVPGWLSADAAEVIQRVQISADGSAYAKHEPKSTAMADALTGAAPRAVTCSFAPPGTIAPAQTVAELVTAQLPVSPPTTSGPAVTVPGAGCATTAWLIANADRLGIASVT
ncbi:MAG: hypothetical protein LBQ06_07560 [Frankiaceae bacterium]|nr:hypothetical protein [Frankiaceae bacterium]